MDVAKLLLYLFVIFVNDSNRRKVDTIPTLDDDNDEEEIKRTFTATRSRT